MNTDSNQKPTATFAPILYLNNGADAIEFYKIAFGAKELRRVTDREILPIPLVIIGQLKKVFEENSYCNCWPLIAQR